MSEQAKPAMCTECGGPLTRGVDEVAREMARRQNDSVFTGVTFGTHPGEVFCWACANAIAWQVWREEQDRARFGGPPEVRL